MYGIKKARMVHEFRDVVNPTFTTCVTDCESVILAINA